MRIPIVPLFASLPGADAVQVGMINGAFMLMAVAAVMGISMGVAFTVAFFLSGAIGVVVLLLFMTMYRRQPAAC